MVGVAESLMLSPNEQKSSLNGHEKLWSDNNWWGTCFINDASDTISSMGVYLVTIWVI